MRYNSEKVTHTYRPEDSSIIVTFSKNYDFFRDAAESSRLAIKLLNNLDVRSYWIVDLRFTKLAADPWFNMDELVLTLNSMYAAVWHHPNVRQVIFVSDDDTLRYIVENLNSEDFGNLNIRIASDVDEALAFARSQKWGTHITYQSRTSNGLV